MGFVSGADGNCKVVIDDVSGASQAESNRKTVQITEVYKW